LRHITHRRTDKRAVQTTKQSLKILKEGDWETKISRFLLKQHSTPSIATGVSPAEMMLKRKLRTPLDSLLPWHKHRPLNIKETPVGARQLQIEDRVTMLTPEMDQGNRREENLCLMK